MAKMTYQQAVNQALLQEMERDETSDPDGRGHRGRVGFRPERWMPGAAYLA